jgi:hypothetical protein
MTTPISAEDILEMGRRYHSAAVLAAAADLDLFSALAPRPLTAADLANRLEASVRGTTILLDALVALGLLAKDGGRYSVPEGIASLLGRHGPGSVLAMTQHQANCLRRWSQLASVVKTGRAAERTPSVRGEEADRESFILAMDNISAPAAAALIRELGDLHFTHLLDVGGGSGTWTLAFLRSSPGSKATLVDLPHVIPLAERRMVNAGMTGRVKLVPGDFIEDPLPGGADLAWVSAIVHQNSREENRLLFGKVRDALLPGGTIAIRDVVMDPTRTSPTAGALFAVNMLVATEGGGTFTFEELCDDLEAEGFTEVALLRQDPWMNSIIVARKPESR